MITREFLTAGRAIFTVSNPKGERYTFRARRETKAVRGDLFDVGLLTGPDNESSYQRVCRLYGDNLKIGWRGGPFPPESKPFKVFKWVVGLLQANKLPPAGYAIQHAGRCGRCGRLLTVPESIESGLGPECSKKGGNGHG